MIDPWSQPMPPEQITAAMRELIAKQRAKALPDPAPPAILPTWLYDLCVAEGLIPPGWDGQHVRFESWFQQTGELP